jgi:hypothetical protein
MRRIVIAKFLCLALVVLYLVIGLTQHPADANGANRVAVTNDCA